MTKWKWGGSFLILLLVLALSSAAALAGEIYLYDESVATEIDLDAYLSNGIVKQPNGQGFFQWVGTGPAPPPYPTIMIPEKNFENLGATKMEMDGIVFVNHGRNLVKNKKAMVLWMIRMPTANMRAASEFHDDMTMALWVDWNKDNAWQQDERVMLHHLNMYEFMPTSDEEIVVYYLTSFLVPDITKIPGVDGTKNRRMLWARACLAYDDPDMSPDGAQIFGEYEDYELSYLITPGKVGQDKKN